MKILKKIRRSRVAIIGIFAFLSYLAVSASAQVQQAWLARCNNGITNGSHRPVGMAFDPAGNVIVAGNSQNAQSNLDYVVIKYSPQGTQLWAARYDSATNGNDEVRGLAMDRDGFIYVTGTSGTIKYSPGGDLAWSAPYGGRALVVNTNGEVYVTGFSEVDFATAKLSASGSNLWVRTLDVAQRLYADVSQKIALDKEGKPVIGGYYPWAYDSRTGYYYELGLVKYDESGNQSWFASVPNLFSAAYQRPEVKTVLTDTNNRVYLAGSIGGSAWLLAQVNAAGQVMWRTSLISTAVVGVMAMAMDAGGNLYATGSAAKDTINYTVYKTFKTDNIGHELWRSDYFEAFPWNNTAYDIAIDGARNVYVTGGSVGTNSGLDWATIKYNPGGRQIWARRYNGTGNSNDEAKGILVDDAGNVYVTGYVMVPGGGSEIVTIKYNQPAAIQRRSDGSMRLQLPAAPDQSVGFQFSTNFLDWLLLGSTLADSNGIATFDDTNAPAYPYGFYRSVSPPPP